MENKDMLSAFLCSNKPILSKNYLLINKSKETPVDYCKERSAIIL
jgi:hypothetical protein